MFIKLPTTSRTLLSLTHTKHQQHFSHRVFLTYLAPFRYPGVACSYPWLLCNWFHVCKYPRKMNKNIQISFMWQRDLTSTNLNVQLSQHITELSCNTFTAVRITTIFLIPNYYTLVVTTGHRLYIYGVLRIMAAVSHPCLRWIRGVVLVA